MYETPSESQDRVAAGADALSILLENHRSFLRYLERRVGDRAIAEDILHDAFVRNLAKIEELPEDALAPWFHRTLRNATIDHYRRRSTANDALEAFAKEVQAAEFPPADLHEEICKCVRRLADTLPRQDVLLLLEELQGEVRRQPPSMRWSTPWPC